MSGLAANAYSERAAACHDLLLRLAGRVPDRLLAEARHWLVAGDLRSLGHHVGSAVVAARAPLDPADAWLLAWLLPGDRPSAAPSAASLAALVGPVGEPAYRFAPAAPSVLRAAGGAIPHRLDLTAGPDRHRHPGLVDELDSAAVGAAADLAAIGAADLAARQRCSEGPPWPGPVALWRGYRFSRSAGIPVRRVYLAQAGDGADPARLALRLQCALARHGEPDPQVEVFGAAQALPPYQRSALGHAALLWCAAPGVPVHVAAVYDTVDPMLGARFDPDHPRLSDGARRARFAAYLTANTPLLAAQEPGGDVLDPDRPAVVPLDLRTDGRFVWSVATAYYLNRYQLAPAAPLLAHLAHVADRPAAPDRPAAAGGARAPGHLELFRAMVALQAVGAQQPGWSSAARPRRSVAAGAAGGERSNGA
ncbi:hypothetical protein GCM10023322_57940 [Rugosimonospora acidiphila]|uniref:Uncharacterized protein n=1 Tax=Rugosimonospora acidiphila TaxID=556531 RepID=A0ABP9SF11_9ACTN